MKKLMIICLLLLGCAARPPKVNHNQIPTVAIPVSCVTSIRATKATLCTDTDDPNWVVCDGVLVKFACMQYLNPKR